MGALCWHVGGLNLNTCCVAGLLTKPFPQVSVVPEGWQGTHNNARESPAEGRLTGTESLEKVLSIGSCGILKAKIK